MFINTQAELLREPNLLVPGKKPIGAVKIDWAHPLTEGLKSYFLLPRKDDLVTGVLPIIDTTTTIVDAQGMASEGTLNTTVRRVYAQDDAHDLSNTDSYTLWSFFKKLANNNGTVGIWSLRDGTATAGDIEWDFNNDDYRLAVHTGSWQIAQSSWTMPAGADWFNMGVAADPGGEFRFSINGVVYTDTNASAIPETPVSDYVLLNTATGRSDGFDGHMYAQATWHRALSNNEMFSLYKDPYQFLVPA